MLGALRSLVGGSQGPKVNGQDRAILSLKKQRDKLQRYQKQIDVLSRREHDIARIALAEGKKDRAMTALRRKKYQESLLSKTDAQLETLQQLVQSVEFAKIEKDVMFGLEQGNKVLQELNRELSVEKVEKLLDDTAEAIAYQREVDEILSSKITADEEDEIQREFEALQAEELKAKMPSIPDTLVVTPEVIPAKDGSVIVEEDATPQHEEGPERVAQLA